MTIRKFRIIFVTFISLPLRITNYGTYFPARDTDENLPGACGQLGMKLELSSDSWLTVFSTSFQKIYQPSRLLRLNLESNAVSFMVFAKRSRKVKDCLGESEKQMKKIFHS